MRKDRLNHNAENYRAMMPVLLVALFGMIAFLYINIEILSIVKIVILSLGILVIAGSIIFQVLQNIKNLKELEEMD